MNVKKVLKLTCWTFILFALVCYPLFDSFAKGQVHPAKQKGAKCKTKRVFRVDDDVFVKARGLPSDSLVDIYVIQNREWSFGDIIDELPFDAVVCAEFDLTTGSAGRIPCALIWEHPLIPDLYDIFVDTNQDGTFNSNDVVENKGKKAGFRVR